MKIIFGKKALKKVLEKLEREWNRIEDKIIKIMESGEWGCEIDKLVCVQRGLEQAAALIKAELGMPLDPIELTLTSDLSDLV